MTKIFYVTLAVSIGLIIGGFFCPPMGVIDGSVLMATGELFLFAALAELPSVVREGRSVTLRRGDTVISIKDEDSETKDRETLEEE